MRRERVGLDRRAGLAREDVERPRGRRRGGANGRRIGRVEHLKARPARRDAEHRAQHLRREARSPHAEQHDVRESILPAPPMRRSRVAESLQPSALASSASRDGWRSSSARPDRRSRPTARGARGPPRRVRRRPSKRPRQRRVGPFDDLRRVKSERCLGGEHAWRPRRAPASASAGRARCACP